MNSRRLLKVKYEYVLCQCLLSDFLFYWPMVNPKAVNKKPKILYQYFTSYLSSRNLDTTALYGIPSLRLVFNNTTY